MERGNGTQLAILLGVYATFALDVFSTLNSSPQTTELFSRDRQDSLMFWVTVGSLVAIGGGAVAAGITGRAAPLFATVGVAAGMYYLYRLAVKRGASQEPPA